MRLLRSSSLSRDYAIPTTGELTVLLAEQDEDGGLVGRGAANAEDAGIVRFGPESDSNLRSTNEWTEKKRVRCPGFH